MDVLSQSEGRFDRQVVPGTLGMLDSAESVAPFLKSLSHPTRLVILCRLTEGPARVSELEDLLAIPQAAVSKQLARLREENMVSCTRDGRSVVYSLADQRVRRVMQVLFAEFCL